MKFPAEVWHWLIAGMTACAIAAPPIAPASFDNEQLHYSVNWPSGLNLGEATLSSSISKPASDGAPQLHLEFSVDASMPGFPVNDSFTSNASAGFCSAEFDRKTTHGEKKVDDKTTFDPHTATAIRETAGGGKTELRASECSRDALTFLYYVRRELSEGRVPPPQTFLFGGFYDVRLDLAGTENIRIGDRQVEADHVTASVKGPVSSMSLDLFFLKDAARTLAVVRVPFSLGTFTMELVK